MKQYRLTPKQNDVLFDIINWDNNDTCTFGYRFQKSSGTKAYEYYMFDFVYSNGSYAFSIDGNGQVDSWDLELGLRADVINKILSYMDSHFLNRGDKLICRRLLKIIKGRSVLSREVVV